MKRRYYLSVLFALFFLAIWLFWPRLAPGPEPAVSVQEGSPPAPPVSPRAEEVVTSEAPRSPPVPSLSPPVSTARPLSEAEIQKVRSKMKGSLAALYGAQKSFLSEYDRYSTDFKVVGFVAEAGEEQWAKFGFLLPFSPEKILDTEDPRRMDSDTFLEEVKGFEYKATARNVNLGDYAHLCLRGCTASADHFEMIAVAELVPGQPPEVWVINEKKELIQRQNGVSHRNP